MAEVTLSPVAPAATPAQLSTGRAPRRLRAAFRRKQAITRWIVILIVAIFMLLPMIGLLDFSTRLFNGKRTGATWSTLIHLSQLKAAAPDLVTGFEVTMLLCVVSVVLTIALLVPTMTWIRLRVPGVAKLVEFICLLPLTIPAIVLVVGLGPIYNAIAKVTGGGGFAGALPLAFAYVILALPYAYRAIDAGLAAIDVKTLSEAARSLGSSWGKVMWKIVLPNIRSAVIGASFLTVALVLGEYTVASLLLKNNLAVALGALGNSAGADPKLTAVVSLVLLVFGFLLMFGFSFIGNGGAVRKARRKVNGAPGIQRLGAAGDVTSVPSPSNNA
jgi:putative spermidine/putrescine transport system permease protein